MEALWVAFAASMGERDTCCCTSAGADERRTASWAKFVAGELDCVARPGYIYICVCVCVCIYVYIYIYIYIYTYVYIYIYIYIYSTRNLSLPGSAATIYTDDSA